MLGAAVAEIQAVSQNGREKLEMSAKDETAFLDAGVERLRPTLEDEGFRYEAGDDATSSGGRFATGFFRRGDLEIGLIVRDRKKLGCPNYFEGRG